MIFEFNLFFQSLTKSAFHSIHYLLFLFLAQVIQYLTPTKQVVSPHQPIVLKMKSALNITRTQKLASVNVHLDI